MGDITPPKNAQVIEVNGITIDPSEHYAKDSKNTDHIIVTLKDTLTHQQQTELEELGVDILEDLGNLNYLCHYDPPDLKPIRALTEFVRQVDVYRNVMKIPENLRDVLDNVLKNQSEKDLIPCALDIMIHASGVDEETVADSIAASARLDRDAFELSDGKIRLTATWQQLQTIVQDDNVRVIEEVIVPELHDNNAVEIVRGPVRGADTVTTLSSYQGKGQTVAVNDTGFDLGSRTNCHPAFTGSIKRLISAGRASGSTVANIPAAQTVDDPEGHGTHVCGTIVAKGIQTDQGLVTGVAPEAKLIMTSLLKDNRELTPIQNVQTLFAEPYTNYDAFIHSNSWGDGLGFMSSQLPYRDVSAAIDDFVCKHPDVLIVFSAGNNNLKMLDKLPKGESKASIGSQAAAKNCITVGASGTTRKLTSETAATAGNTDTARSELQVFNPDMVLSDSSRGPTLEKRTKPDVVAPGYNIFSAFSRHPKVNYSAAKAMSEQYANILWKVRSGTSHATPLVAGCAAILREIYQEKNGGPSSKPPAALLKAVIINGANRLPNVDKEAQGFGRVNLQNSAAMLESPAVRGEIVSSTTTLPSYPGGTLIGQPLKHLDTFSFNIDPPAVDIVSDDDRDKFELKVTMVYNDLPGKEMQNNLNLAVIDHSADVLHHGGISEDVMDLQNNVEQVVISPVPKTPVTVRVVAQKMFKPAEGTQDFALAWSVGRVYTGFEG